jgi:alpha-1,2-mannosyltransferase
MPQHGRFIARASRRPNVHSSRQSVLTLLFLLGAFNVALGLAVNWRTENFRDFGVFYESARAWRYGQSPYAVPNFNPPIFVLATTPLGMLPVRQAWVLWQVLSFAALWFTVRLVFRSAGPFPRTIVLMVGTMHASTAAQTQFGQVAWLLGLPLTLAWVAWRDGRDQVAGAWFGIALALKPFLAPVLIVALVSRPWRRMTYVAIGMAGLITVLGVALVSIDVHHEYLRYANVAWQLTDQPTLGSLTGMLHRLALAPGWSLVLSSVVWIPVLVAWRRSSRDQQWLLAITAALLTSPLGWVHYQAWLVGPVLACWRSLNRSLRLFALCAGCLPPVLAAAVSLLQPLYLLSLLAWHGAAYTAVSPQLLRPQDTNDEASGRRDRHDPIA